MSAPRWSPRKACVQSNGDTYIVGNMGQNVAKSVLILLFIWVVIFCSFQHPVHTFLYPSVLAISYFFIVTRAYPTLPANMLSRRLKPAYEQKIVVLQGLLPVKTNMLTCFLTSRILPYVRQHTWQTHALLSIRS